MHLSLPRWFGMRRARILYPKSSLIAALAVSLALAPTTAVALETWVDLRDRGVVKQSLDYSCGAAALATLAQSQWGWALTEAQVVDAWYEQNRYRAVKETGAESYVTRGEQAITQEQNRSTSLVKVGDTIFDVNQGMSFDGIAQLGSVFGYQAKGLKVPLHLLSQLKQPVLLYLEDFGQPHFTVLQSSSENGVVLADPSWGNVLVNYHDLEGIIPDDHARILWLRPDVNQR